MLAQSLTVQSQCCVQLSMHAVHLAVVVLSWPNLPMPDTYCRGKFCHKWTNTSGTRAARVRTDLGLCQQSQEATAHKTWMTENDTGSNEHSSDCGGKRSLPSGCQALFKANSQRIISLCLASVCSQLIHDLLLLENQNRGKKITFSST